MEDYFSHAYGEDWREVVEIFKKIRTAFDPGYFWGRRCADLRVNKRYAPACAEEFRKMPAIAEEAKEFLEAHRVMPMRAQTVMYKLLRYYMEYCCGLAKCLIPKCYGAGKEAAEMWEKFVADFGRHECEIESCYDQWMMYYACEHKVFASQEMTVPTVEN
jgi:hypothetical protein